MVLSDLGVTEADDLLPETGTLILKSSFEKPCGVSLLLCIHLVIVRPEMLRADMHQVFAEAKESHYLVFVTSPTAPQIFTRLQRFACMARKIYMFG